MKLVALSALLLSVFIMSAPSFAQISSIANSTNYKAFIVMESGSSASSNNYNALVTIESVTGLATSPQYKSCLGYVCVEFGPLGEIVRVTFLLQLNVSGVAGDIGYVDNNTAVNTYSATDISRYFGCVEDPAQQGSPTFGLAFAGSRLNYIRLENNGEFSIRLSQDQPSNRFVLPVTISGCDAVRSKMPLGFPFTPFVPFAELLNAIELIKEYPVNLIGQFEKNGAFTLILEKTDQNSIVGRTP